MTDRALAQIPAELIEGLEILIRTDSAGATHEFAGHCHDGDLRYSFGYELTDTIRQAIIETPQDKWIAALDQDDSERDNGQVVELTDRLDLSSWPAGSRVIIRRERPHPGAQPSFTDHDGHRFQAILTDQADQDIAVIERRHRQRARIEDRIRDDKNTRLGNLPFKQFQMNEAWVQIVMLAHDLLIWTQALALDGHHAKAEPKTLRYRLLHVAGRLEFSGPHRQATPAEHLALGYRTQRQRSRNSKRSPCPGGGSGAAVPRGGRPGWSAGCWRRAASGSAAGGSAGTRADRASQPPKLDDAAPITQLLNDPG